MMKAAFLAICLVCAGLASTLIFTIQTGKIPFRDAVVPVESPGIVVATNAADKGLVPFSEADHNSMAEMVKAFDTEKASLAAQRAELAARDENIKLKEAAQEVLKVEVENLQNQLAARIFEIKTERQLNLRRLADMYAKMDPALASNLLREGDRKNAAAIIGIMPDRAMAAIMDATVQAGGTNMAAAAEWVDTIRTMTVEKKPEASE